MLIHWAKDTHRYIIEDDYDIEFRYTQQPFPTLASIDSKSHLSGEFLKIISSWNTLMLYVLPEPLLTRYKSQFLYFESTTFLLSQLTMAKFMEDGEWNRHIKRMRLVYKRKMLQLILKAFQSNYNHYWRTVWLVLIN